MMQTGQRRLRCWLIEIGEPLPIDPGPPRLMRTGLLAARLARAGHDVLWWASRFDHIRRRFRESQGADPVAGGDVSIRLLKGGGYVRSVSLSRLLHHRRVAAEFVALAPSYPKPDIILCCMPTLELAAEAVRYGKAHGVPVLLDLRDLWPDIFVEMMPRQLRAVGRVLIQPAARNFATTCAAASGLIAITSEFLEWGLGYAGRQQGGADRVVPHAYPAEVPPQSAVTRAEDFWNARGVLGSPDSFLVTFVGTLSTRTARQGCLSDAFEAAGMLEQRCPRLKLVICGGGEAFPWLAKKASEYSNVIVPGQVDHAGVWTLLSRSSIGLVPYPNSPDFSRSIPNKVGEYLSMGLPVTSSLDGALGRFLREHSCGQVYPAGNSARLAELWARLYDDRPGWEQTSRRATEAYSAHLSADRVYSGLVAHLEYVAASYRRGLTA